MFAQSDFPKIKIFNSSKKEWMAALLDEIDEDQLPTYYGGNMTDATNGDPKCPIKVNNSNPYNNSNFNILTKWKLFLFFFINGS